MTRNSDGPVDHLSHSIEVNEPIEPHILKAQLSKLHVVQNLAPERKPACTSELMDLGRKVFSGPEQRRLTKIKKNLDKALKQLKKKNCDLTWLPPDCWPFLEQDAPLSSREIERDKQNLIQQIEQSILDVEYEADALGESRGGPNKNYALNKLAHGLGDIYRRYTGSRATHSYKDGVGFSSDFDKFALEAYRILLPAGMEVHQRAFADACGQATKISSVTILENPET